MGHPVLRLFDGSDSTSPDLRDEVKELQTLLDKDGFPLEVDGIFGRDTESAVRQFQDEHGLATDWRTTAWLVRSHGRHSRERNHPIPAR